MKSRYWGDKNKKVDYPAEYSSWRDPHEGIWIDALRFQQLFFVLTPWGASEMGEALAERCFRVSETKQEKKNKNSFIAFKHFIKYTQPYTRQNLKPFDKTYSKPLTAVISSGIYRLVKA